MEVVAATNAFMELLRSSWKWHISMVLGGSKRQCFFGLTVLTDEIR